MPYRLSFRIGVVALALSLAPVFPVHAGPGLAVTADGQTADDATACEVQAVPHCGDAAAQYHLGMMFKNGISVPRDPVAALGWFLCAARSDGQIGIDAARWAEQLSSSKRWTVRDIGHYHVLCATPVSAKARSNCAAQVAACRNFVMARV